MVFLPIGLIGSVYIAALRHNDTGVLNMSRLNQELFEIFTSGVPFAMGYLVGNLLPCLYLSPPCYYSTTVCEPFPGSKTSKPHLCISEAVHGAHIWGSSKSIPFVFSTAPPSSI